MWSTTWCKVNWSSVYLLAASTGIGCADSSDTCKERSSWGTVLQDASVFICLAISMKAVFAAHMFDKRLYLKFIVTELRLVSGGRARHPDINVYTDISRRFPVGVIVRRLNLEQIQNCPVKYALRS